MVVLCVGRLAVLALRHLPWAMVTSSDGHACREPPAMPTTARVFPPPPLRVRCRFERRSAASFRVENVAKRDAGEDWRRFDVTAIPSKDSTPHLDRFLSEVTTTAVGHAPRRLLDIGCGDGRLAKRLYEQGFSVTGVDVSLAAVHAAQGLAVTADPSGELLRFHEADMAADAPPRIDAKPFDVVVCQFVLLIIGDARQRRKSPASRADVSSTGRLALPLGLGRL